MTNTDLILERLADPDRISKLREARIKALQDPFLRDLFANGLGYDVSFHAKTKQGDYILPWPLPDEVLFVDAFWSTFIQSIGASKKRLLIEMATDVWQMLPENTVIASWTDRYVIHDDFICIYKR